MRSLRERGGTLPGWTGGRRENEHSLRERVLIHKFKNSPTPSREGEDTKDKGGWWMNRPPLAGSSVHLCKLKDLEEGGKISSTESSM